MTARAIDQLTFPRVLLSKQLSALQFSFLLVYFYEVRILISAFKFAIAQW